MKYNTLKVKIKHEKYSYSIHICSNEVKSDWQKQIILKNEKVLIVTDDYVYKLYSKDFPVDNSNSFYITFPNGEENKNFESLTKIYQKLHEIQADRNTKIIALGGGVVGDLAGYAAATYLRGIPLIQIPTTLLSQIDSSIGGKVGYNFGGKNLIGTFYHPMEVYSDSFFWKTLDNRQWTNGLGEVVKYAFLLDREYFFSLDDNYLSIQKRPPKVMQRLIKAGLMFKMRIVEMDEKENDIRRVLNLGHTIGHAIETAGDYKKYLHGEAIFLGLKAVLFLSFKRNILKKSEYELGINLINHFFDGVLTENIKNDYLLELIAFDKKVKNGKNHWILIKEIGKPMIVDDISKKEIIAALDSIRE